MSIDRRWTGKLTVAVVLSVLASCGGNAQADSAAEAEGESGAFVRVINVETQVVEKRPFEEVITITGTVQANRDVTVSAEESGVIRQIFVEKGTPVSAGRALAKIDDRVLRAQVDQARAAAEFARETWERRRRLWEEDQVGSELAYLEARYNAEQTAANLAALEERLDRTTIRAPISGVMDSREIEVGSMVTVGTPVARIVSLNPVKVTGGVPERYAPDVSVGSHARVTFDFNVLDSEVYEGDISFVGSAVNPRNRTFPVELQLANPGRVIKPEMVANIEVIRRSLQESIVAPQEALVRVETGYVAFVVVEHDGREVAEVRSLELGPSQRDLVVVNSGLAPGDRLIVVGQQQVADGDRVTVVSPSN
jgi:membrane fusion protein (multidrug efflux system)